jgi:hypothetical protein
MNDQPDAALMVLGSLSNDEHDRLDSEDSLRPVQVLRSGQFDPLDVDWPSDLGASTGVPFNGGVALASQSTIHMRDAILTGLHDVHELSVDRDSLWIPNTGSNELLSVSISGDVERHYLGSGYHHCNQVFRCAAGARWGLVHHIHGRQLLRRVAGRILKSQGDGGLLSLDHEDNIELRLAAPHSARVINGENWILDSGRAVVRRYSADWTELGQIALGGWGRGAQVTLDEAFMYVGLSPLRRRYQSVSQVSAIRKPEVHVIDVERQEVVERLPVDGIDQINGLLFASVDAVRAATSSTAPEVDVVGSDRVRLSESADE